MTDAHVIEEMLTVMARLRDPENGCPWDLQQTFASIAPYTVEEAFEVADAIAAGDHDGLRDELGDLLLQVIFHAQMAREQGLFDFDDVTRGLIDKMVRRHPHVFGDRQGASLAEIKDTWEATKVAEQAANGQVRESQLDGVPAGLPALQRAAKLQKKASRVGFDWDQVTPVLAQVRAELDELEAAMAAGEADAITDELGDVLFSVVNLSRHLRTDAEQALRGASHKFERRFRLMEQIIAEQGASLAGQDPVQLDALWREAKRRGGA
ncbi:nucleoside triphosphate pyrophosphohydrolase [Alcanivorax sp. JB21]|uniref:nucleoside triphosphate pyrophosphohydrolase n=1 Tax=Alcanivorax limicola TaxID=2874102 RepID=UPI001CBCABE0|nr:nucleoside triphosphate pyrophosphohydrolase [Alcanivorax limicola]MBZ2189846.1 nucleoside triphosphate pyrophosphohydrolase [Alcanivorax limicola]